MNELLQLHWGATPPTPLPHDPWTRAPLSKPRYFPLCVSWAEHVQEYLIPALLQTATECNVPVHRLWPLLCLRGMEVPGLATPALARIRQLETALSNGANNALLTDWRHGLGARSNAPPEVLVRGLLYKYRSPADRQDAIYRTLQYAYFHMRSGILVRIERGKVRLFAPFFNQDPGACNLWAERGDRAFHIGTTPLNAEDGALESAVVAYYQRKAREWGRAAHDDGFLRHPKYWWANAYLIDNVPQPDGWSDHWNPELKSMLDAVCDRFHVSDCTFFLNKRDYPYLRYDGARVLEPYPFLFRAGSTPVGLFPHVGMDYDESTSYAPVFSFAGDPALFADVLMPTVDDWTMANGENAGLPPSARLPQWSDRRAVAVFRGSSTGRGVTAATNPRWALMTLPESPLLDAALTSWCLRDRVTTTHELAYPAHKETARVKRVGRRYRLTYDQQAAYKWIVYIEGHSAAYRYGNLMHLGSCILRVRETCDASMLWFFPRLVGHRVNKSEDAAPEHTTADHILVPSIEALPEVLAWCREHDAFCAQVAANARTFAARWLSREAILAYWFNALSAVHANQYRLLTQLVPVPLESTAVDEVAAADAAVAVNARPTDMHAIDAPPERM